MSAEAFAYVAGGAGTGATMRANRAAFDRWRIVPRMLRDVGERDTSVELFGRTLPSPFLIAPIGVLEMAHREAERAVARAVRDLGLPMIYSNQASVPMEEVTEILGDAPRWFQLYWSTREELVESFAGRAEACGCEAIVVTLDTTMLGWRTRDLDLGWLPFLRGMGIAQYTSDPVFTRLLSEPSDSGQPEPKPSLAALRVLIQLTRNYPGPFLSALRSGRARAAVQRFVQIYSRPSLTWADLPFLRERTSVPILLKGDAAPGRRAARRGRGDRRDRRLEPRRPPGGRSDRHARRAARRSSRRWTAASRCCSTAGSGAAPTSSRRWRSAPGRCCSGRPHVYGLALAGEDGVREVVTNFMADFDLTMGLAGCRSVGGDHAQRRWCPLRAEPEQPAQVGLELVGGVVQLPPGDSDDAPARRLEAPVPGAVLLEGCGRVVRGATVQLDDDALLRPRAVDLDAFDADVGERSWKASIKEKGLEVLFEFASDEVEAALCFFKDGSEDGDAGLAGIAVDQRAEAEPVGEPELLGLPHGARVARRAERRH